MISQPGTRILPMRLLYSTYIRYLLYEFQEDNVVAYKKRNKFYETDNEGMFRAYPSLHEIKKKSMIKLIIKWIKERLSGK